MLTTLAVLTTAIALGVGLAALVHSSSARPQPLRVRVEDTRPQRTRRQRREW